MDMVTLIDKDKKYLCRYAAPSILTGRFVACVIGSTEESIREDFTNPGDIFVHNVENLYADKTYTGYTELDELRISDDDIKVILSKQKRTVLNNGAE